MKAIAYGNTPWTKNLAGPTEIFVLDEIQTNWNG